MKHYDKLEGYKMGRPRNGNIEKLAENDRRIFLYLAEDLEAVVDGTISASGDAYTSLDYRGYKFTTLVWKKGHRPKVVDLLGLER